MIEKVSKYHPDKLADRIGGAIVDLAYTMDDNPKVACEILLGHGSCFIINETSLKFDIAHIYNIVERIAGDVKLTYIEVPQDPHLEKNQKGRIKCGDNGIFKGVPLTEEEKDISKVAKYLDEKFPFDGKYILDHGELIVCQSNADDSELIEACIELGYPNSVINPLGKWTGGIEVDTGAINRKLGSDMAESVTGGGIHGKDLSKADVSVNIYAFAKAQETGKVFEGCCAIGDTEINGIPYQEIVDFARNYIKKIGGFEALATYGLY